MTDNRLQEEVRQMRTQGNSEEKILEHLSTRGWNKDDIRGALAASRLSSLQAKLAAPITLTNRFSKSARVSPSDDSVVTWLIAISLLSISAITVFGYIGIAALVPVPSILGLASSTSAEATSSPFAFIPPAPITIFPAQFRSFTTQSTPAPAVVKTAVPAVYGAAQVTAPSPADPGVPLINFAANQTNVTPGTSVLLTWDTKNASYCQADGFDATAQTNGRAQVVVYNPTTFTLTCKNSYHSIQQQISISVNASSNPDSNTSNQGTTDTTSAGTVPGGDGGTVATSGSGVVSVPSDGASTTPSTGSVDTSAIIGPTASTGYEVYPGCDVPPTDSGSYKRTVYVDAQNGSDTGDGSQAKPYKSLATLLGKKLIHAGDHVILMPGNYGDIKASRWSDPELQQESSSWIWLDFQPGATVNTISFDYFNHWFITHATIFTYGAPSLIALANSNNMVVADSAMGGAQDSSGWTATDWLKQGQGFVADSGYCTSFLRNRITNIRFGIVILAPRIQTPPSGYDERALIKDNVLKNFSADGIRPIGSDIHITHNAEYDEYLSEADGDGNHDDGSQSWSYNGYVYSNLVIDHNWIQETTDPSRKYNAPLQGIDNFDSTEDHLNVSYNVVLTSAYHGISFYAPTNGIIDHNTVLDPTGSLKSLWIYVAKGKLGQLPSNMVVSNNIADKVMTNYAPAVTFENNFTLGTSSPTNLFEAFDPAHNNYNFTPKPGSLLDGKNLGAVGVKSSIAIGNNAPRAQVAVKEPIKTTAATAAVENSNAGWFSRVVSWIGEEIHNFLSLFR